ncbi:MAG: GyrI-like domain-containing protein [Dehalococcoidales bacterium]|nr:MAG: GyrI-like domain-containing protein [Dehalococcoidales bacterium]
MEPKLYEKEAMIIAGVSGNGDETGKVWEDYMKLEKLNPLKNTLDAAGYEVRIYPGGTGPGKVHIGMNVTDTKVPPEYKCLSVPASLYAEFLIYPAKGYGSSNEEMDAWLSDNADKYTQRYIDGNPYGIEVYDERFKGNGDSESIVGMLIPLEVVKE